jgi:alpha-ketoglutarate-dependent taurine dioxygenase
MLLPPPSVVEFTELAPVTGYLESNGFTSVLVYPVAEEVGDLSAWVRRHRESILSALHTCGAVLLRNVATDLELFERIVQSLGGNTLPYRERSTPRTKVRGNVYTSTEYPADQRIPLHNENSYSDSWPDRLFFLCAMPAETGGETPVADSRAVFDCLDLGVRERFADGVRYTRTYRDGLGLGWQESFQTTVRAEVEKYCGQHAMQCEWDGQVLRTSVVRPAWRDDPRSGVPVWFNQAHLFHVSALDEEIREALLSLHEERDLPRNAYHADGSPLRADDLAAIERAYRECALALPWRAGDLLMVDNIVAAHGRMPYTGSRRILVAMT